MFVAKASIGGAYRYNDSTSSVPVASYVLGPVLSGETAQCIIPLNNVNTLFTTQTAQAFVSTFDPTKLTVTVSGKTEGVDYNYYVEDTSTAIFGHVPGIIFLGSVSLSVKNNMLSTMFIPVIKRSGLKFNLLLAILYFCVFYSYLNVNRVTFYYL